MRRRILRTGTVGNGGGRQCLLGHHAVDGAIAGRQRELRAGTHLGISQVLVVLIVNPSVGSITQHIQIDVVGVKESRHDEAATPLEVPEECYTVGLAEVPDGYYGGIAEVRLVQRIVGCHHHIGCQRVLHDQGGILRTVHRIGLAVAALKGGDGIAEGAQLLILVAVVVLTQVDNAVGGGILHMRRAFEDELEVLDIAGLHGTVGSSLELQHAIQVVLHLLSVHVPFHMPRPVDSRCEPDRSIVGNGSSRSNRGAVGSHDEVGQSSRFVGHMEVDDMRHDGHATQPDDN